MLFGKFLAAWGKNWIALMSGIASIALLFWAAIWPPSQDQLKHAIFFVSAVCFVFGSYRIWSAEHQRWLDLTGKTREEFFADAIAEFTKLERWYGSDECTRRGPLDRLIEKTFVEVRRYAPDHVLVFKDAANNPNAFAQSHLPLGHPNRTIEEIANWRSDEERERCWRTTSACLYALKSIRRYR